MVDSAVAMARQRRTRSLASDEGLVIDSVVRHRARGRHEDVRRDISGVSVGLNALAIALTICERERELNRGSLILFLLHLYVIRDPF